MNWFQRHKRGQSLVIIALSATVLFGIIALGLDAGRLYFERRDVQNAADAAALAGAQELLPQGGDPGVSTQMAENARCVAAEYAFKTWNDAPANDCTTWWNQQPAQVAAANTPARVTITTPSRNNPNEIAVRVDYVVPLTFATVMGFRSSTVSAVAYAHGGFYNKTYTVFGFSATGSGNSITDDQNGYAQIDNGNGGNDMCPNPDVTKGKMVSNAKFHVPNPQQPGINLNGQFYYAQASDTHSIQTYWYGTVSPSTSNVEPVPNYESPVKPAPSSTDPSPNAIGTINGKPAYAYEPGTYTHNITLNNNAVYIFHNGIYWFQDANFSISGSATASNTSDGQPKYTTFSDGFTGGRSDLGAASDGTNGVEFVFDGNAAFSATSPKSGGGPSIFFVAPSFVSSGTDSIAFFIRYTDTISGPNGTPWSETMTGGSFQIYGTVYNADNNGSNGTVAELKAVSSIGGTNPSNHYAVTGEFVTPQAQLENGDLANEASINSSSPCPPNGNGKYNQNPAGLLVQFSPHYAPHFRGYSYLVK
jgi:Flp pilus assembly protein TadG